MEAESRRMVLIGAALVVILAVAVGYRLSRDLLRPRLVEARVVTATATDPVLRDGPRHVAADEEVRIAVAVRVERPGSGSTWLAPGERLVLGGTPVEHTAGDTWPENDRTVRVFWFTVECAALGGELTTANAAQRLAYRTFLAPELGRGLSATGLPESHADDDYVGGEGPPDGAGTARLYARVEVVAHPGQVQSIAATTTLGPDRLADPAFPALHRGLEPSAGIHPEAGELFLLPGFEPQGEPANAWNQVTVGALGRSFTDLVRARLVASSWTFAAEAAAGSAELDPSSLQELGPLHLVSGRLQRRGRVLRWGTEALPGDLVRSGRHWVVLAGDDGDGLLGPADRALHCWRRPPATTTLAEAFDLAGAPLDHLRAPTPQ